MTNNNKPGIFEFMILMATMTAIEAFSIDAITPALGQISHDLNITADNYRQFVVTAFVLGYSFGLLVYGFLSDQFGRRKPVVFGFLVYLIGTAACIFADNFLTLIVGRIIQGVGAAGPYVICIAIVRDLYAGRQMAKVMSLINMVFIGIPIVAPFIGQGVLLWLGWRSIFTVMAIFAVATMAWFLLRQAETLKIKDRITFSTSTAKSSAAKVISCSQSMRYMFITGVMMGSFFAFLSTGQQIFQDIYQLGTLFPAVFASLATMIGLSSYLNSRWVEKLGSSTLIHRALIAMIVCSCLVLLTALVRQGSPPLSLYLVYLLIIMFSYGLLFGNIMSLAMEPMGEIAGAASSLIGSAGSFIAITVATLIGTQLVNNSLTLVTGFLICSCIAWALNYQTLKARTQTTN